MGRIITDLSDYRHVVQQISSNQHDMEEVLRDLISIELEAHHLQLTIPDSQLPIAAKLCNRTYDGMNEPFAEWAGFDSPYNGIGSTDRNAAWGIVNRCAQTDLLARKNRYFVGREIITVNNEWIDLTIAKVYNDRHRRVEVCMIPTPRQPEELVTHGGLLQYDAKGLYIDVHEYGIRLYQKHFHALLSLSYGYYHGQLGGIIGYSENYITQAIQSLCQLFRESTTYRYKVMQKMYRTQAMSIVHYLHDIGFLIWKL